MEHTSTPFHLIFPAHNEEKNIVRVMSLFCEYFTHPEMEFHIVVNGCSDHTYDEAQKVAASDKRVMITQIKEKIGKGGAIVAGFHACRTTLPYIGFVDADGSVAPEELGKLVDALDADTDLDIAMASRWTRGSVFAKRQPFTRQIWSRLFNLFVRVLFGFPYKDTQCGGKLMRRKAFERVKGAVRERGFAIDIDLIWQAHKRGLDVAEIPIVWGDDPNSSVQPRKILWPLVKALLRIRFS